MNKTPLKWLGAGLGTVLMLSGCASTSQQLATSIGQPADRLVQALGQPDADYTLQNGDRVLQWQSWSTRKEPRYYFSVPRMTYAVQAHDVHGNSTGFGQPYDVGHYSVEACVVWVQLDSEGIIERGKAHGHGC